jgi:hypothetical protein
MDWGRPKTELKRMFRPKRKEITGGWRKFHKEELHKAHSSRDIVACLYVPWIRPSGFF